MFNDQATPNQPTPSQPIATNAPSIAAPAALKAAAPSNVYVMPEKFHPQKSDSLGKGIIIAAIVLLLVIGVAGAYFAYDYFSKNQQPVPPIENNQPAPTPEVPLTETPVVPETATSTPLIEEVESSTPEVQVPPPASTTPPNTNLPPKISRDSDSDGLTDVEEEIIGTDPAKPDSDGDGFKDGAEALNSYSPLKPGGAKLADDSWVAVLKTNFSANNFSTLYPKVWQVSYLPETEQAIISATTGEIIKVSVQSNNSGLSAINWYLDGHPEVNATELVKIDAGNLSGLIAPNGLTAYLTAPDKKNLYVFEYLLTAPAEMKYPTIFSLIIKNFKLVTAEPATNPDTNPAGY